MFSEKIEARLAARVEGALLRRSIGRTWLIGRSRWSIAAEISPALRAKRLLLFGRPADNA